MINDQLINYIRNQHSLGIPKNDIKNALLGVGWKELDVEDAFTEMNIVDDVIIKQEVMKDTVSPYIKNEVVDINRLNGDTSINVNTNKKQSTKNGRLTLILFLILLLVLFGFAYFIYQKSVVNNNQKTSQNENINPALNQGDYVNNMYNTNPQPEQSTNTSTNTEMQIPANQDYLNSQYGINQNQN